jgi:hypothetical protein
MRILKIHNKVCHKKKMLVVENSFQLKFELENKFFPIQETNREVFMEK